MDPQIYCSKRFTRSYNRASPGLRRLAEGATHDLVRQCRTEPKTWLQRYDRVENVGNHRLLEVDLAGGPRMVVDWSQPQLTLVDMGDHELVPRAHLIDLKAALKGASPAPDLFDPRTAADFFVRNPDVDVWEYGSELSQEWVYQLDEQQGRVLESLMAAVEDEYLEARARAKAILVVGGLGTGKTSILVNLADYIHSQLKLRVAIRFPPQVLDYVVASTGDALPWTSLTGRGGYGTDVLLIDDPDSIDEVQAAADNAGGPAVVVAAFDPLQLRKGLEDETLNSVVRRTNAEVIALTTCYRQKENVGIATQRVITRVAESTPFADRGKIKEHRESRKQLTKLANTLEFVNPHGYTEIHNPATPAHFETELLRIRTSGRVWSHWPSLLVATEESIPYTAATFSLHDWELEAAICGLDMTASIKGVEYPHVFVILSEPTYGQIAEGFKASGRRVYDQRRLLRIPFSRARDSLVVFVAKSVEGGGGLFTLQ